MAVTGSAAALGTLSAVRRAAALPPAEAMRPEAPPNYRMTIIERIGLQRWLSQPTRMILRQLERKPLKAGASIIGLSLSVAILVVGVAFVDIIYTLIDIQANVVHREDVSVGFNEPRSRDALHEIESLPGVDYAEPYRAVSARVRFGHRNRRLAIQGIPHDTRLNRVLNTDLEPFDLPREGILLSRILGDSLKVRPGDEVIVEVMEGARPTRSVKVAALVDDFMGVSAYMEIGSLNRLMREGGVISGVHLLTRGEAGESLLQRLRARPTVASVSSKATSIDNLRKMVEEQLLYSIAFNVLFAGIIAFGIVYNNARVSLSERARELASLRVLGLRRREISFILLGEQALLTLVALPIGFVLGYWLTFSIMIEMNSEVIRLPMVINRSTYALAAVCVIFAAVVSGLIVRRRLDRLDLVEVLKTRE
jgi:putative ABC transport system permease protein